MATLLKIDKNGSKHFQGLITCDRCGGSGLYAHHIENGQIVPTWVDSGICHKCHGKGKVIGKWIERTPEYQAKLDAKRQAKIEAEQERIKAERQAIEAEQKRKEEEEQNRIKALKAISQFYGEVGQRVELQLFYERSASWERPSFKGFGTEKMYAHIFKDANGNVFVWKTTKWLGNVITSKLGDENYYEYEQGQMLTVKASIKEHSEYNEEKQTILTRCQIIEK